MQVGDLHIMAGLSQAAGKGIENGAAQRFTPRMAEDGKNFHGSGPSPQK